MNHKHISTMKTILEKVIKWLDFEKGAQVWYSDFEMSMNLKESYFHFMHSVDVPAYLNGDKYNIFSCLEWLASNESREEDDFKIVVPASKLKELNEATKKAAELINYKS